MNPEIIKEITNSLNLEVEQVENVLQLLAEKNTIPFIARYRKEFTKGLDENQIFEIEQVYQYQENLKKRQEDVIRLIEEKGLLTNDLKQAILKANKIVEVDNIYQPFKDKKKTKASIAIEFGLEPLALKLMNQPHFDLDQEVSKYLNENVKTKEEAISYAQDIIAQYCTDNLKVRDFVSENIAKYSYLVTKVKKKHDDEKKIYEMYYDYQERFSSIANHRLLGINRAVNQKVVTLNFHLEKDYNVDNIYKYFFSKKNFQHQEILYQAIEDGYKRLLFPSITRQLLALKLESASEQAINIFAKNLEALLMAYPLKNKVILGLDPGFRTGCKLAIIDKDGSLLDIDLLYLHQEDKAMKTLNDLVKKFNVDIIAIGNGTASRESEQLVANTIKQYQLNCEYIIVSEAGASVYSASKIAQEEFKDLKVEQRSAISIARRLADPLSELIKIDSKSIGVGQYQHDVNQKELSAKLDFTVEKIVNEVGVDLNSASSYLLTYISGLNKSIAEEIVKFRQENNGFTNRKQLLKVKKLGAKAYEQAAGFLRIIDAQEPLDSTIIHPESYDKTYQLLELLDLNIKDINNDSFKEKIKSINQEEICLKLDIDEYTLVNIIKGLLNPNLDVRETLTQPQLKSDIMKIEDLSIGMELEGSVRNVLDFGVFVDIGLKNDALLHISKISRDYLEHPLQVFSVNDIIKVRILEIDLNKQQVKLTLI